MKKLQPQQQKEILGILRERFERNPDRHGGAAWEEIESKLLADPGKLWSLNEMERTGGEPDLAWFDKKSGRFIFIDFSPESPKGRRNTCYDGEGEEKRLKEGINPGGNALDMAATMGVGLLDEENYRKLQELGEFDTKTSSWIITPADIRKRGGALFCDRRYGHVFTYHNGAQSFYSARGFRGMLEV